MLPWGHPPSGLLSCSTGSPDPHWALNYCLLNIPKFKHVHVRAVLAKYITLVPTCKLTLGYPKQQQPSRATQS